LHYAQLDEKRACRAHGCEDALMLTTDAATCCCCWCC